MKTMFVLISHAMTREQKRDAVQNWGVRNFVEMDGAQWAQIPADTESILPFLRETMHRLEKDAKEGDLLFVQGDFGATLVMVQYAYRLELTPVYATTERRAAEKVSGETVTTTRIFKHVRFRKYERIE